jgi:hypothetical protein
MELRFQHFASLRIRIHFNGVLMTKNFSFFVQFSYRLSSTNDVQATREAHMEHSKENTQHYKT